ncbi:hypothetical protein BOTBODRAFT_177833 [Botryobasidium botryosum FD-172 SS1]|uniref:Actin-like ATPase domain-containing protein n=1 Tax=Botryobasidium botryosum (strain FD-172 SS1) TaxID=930990 RepID=A0A067MGN8_BOTB1|nr:hypothetical protein BOTBODRAFT_177833 [Botryobasidium botryosum FD-172 SS1]
MPVKSSTPPHFLGLELSTEQLRATIVDEDLAVIGSEIVDFDTDLIEYQTRGGMFTTPGDAYTTPVEMWVKALDLLMERIRKRFDLGRIKTIGGCAQNASVWWTPESLSYLANLNPAEPLSTQLTAAAFSLLHTPVAQDTSTLAQSQALEAALGGPDAMAARVSTSAHLALTAAQAMKVREGNPDAWARTARVSLASTFLSSVLMGAWAPMAEAEVSGTGMWSAGGAGWDEEVLELVAGSKEEGRRFKEMLGEVESFGGKKIGTVSPYFVERYGFDHDAFLIPFSSDHLSVYLSLCPSSTDAIVSFGSMDVLLTPAPHYLPSRLYNLYPHPAQDPQEKRKYIAMLLSRNADVPRALVRDMYTKSWSAFDRLVSVVPPGGSIGLDDKLFSFWVLQGESFPFAHVKGIFRFETGVKVNEFRDLRANPRCLLESQLLSFRVRYARMVSSGLFYPSRPSRKPRGSIASSLGIAFDPYDATHLPRRILAVGSAANFPSVVGLLSDVFNAPVFVPSASPSTSSAADKNGVNGALVKKGGLLPTPSRESACLGSAYMARWAWKRVAKPEERRESFEDEIRTLLRKRWISTNGIAAADASAIIRSNTASYSQIHARSALSAPTAAAINEEDEDELEEDAHEKMGNGNGTSSYPHSPLFGSEPRTRTTTSSSSPSLTSALNTPSLTASSSVSTLLNGALSQVPTPTPGTPSPPTAVTLTALPTDDVDAQAGLLKVADSDNDAFMTYAAIVPEYCRLEGMLVKALV